MSDTPPIHLLCIGLGYSARAIVHQLAARGSIGTVTATATSEAGYAGIAAAGYHALAFDGTAPSAGLDAAIRAATHVVLSAPPDAAGDPVLRHHASAFAAAGGLRHIAYLSTIGVYGDHAGAWVDEDVPPAPQSERSRRRAEAEQAWLELGDVTGRPVTVFRLAGIYGPGRSAIDSLREGTARRVIKPGQVFNRIHVEDIAGAVIAAFDGSPRHRVYNITDDEPAPPQDVIAYAAELMGVPVPPDIPFAQAQLSPMGASFYAENKRASNARAKGDLGWRLRYPSYREGLRALAST